MSDAHQICVYGSLRERSSRGFNCGAWGPQHYQRTITLPGFVMRDLGLYPAVHRATDEDGEAGALGIVAEIHEIDESTLATLTYLEEGAGYTTDTVMVDGAPITIFLMQRAAIAHLPVVDKGDWV